MSPLRWAQSVQCLHGVTGAPAVTCQALCRSHHLERRASSSWPVSCTTRRIFMPSVVADVTAVNCSGFLSVRFCCSVSHMTASDSSLLDSVWIFPVFPPVVLFCRTKDKNVRGYCSKDSKTIELQNTKYQ